MAQESRRQGGSILEPGEVLQNQDTLIQSDDKTKLAKAYGAAKAKRLTARPIGNSCGTTEQSTAMRVRPTRTRSPRVLTESPHLRHTVHRQPQP